MLFEVEQGEDLASLRGLLSVEGPQGDMAREIMSECPQLSRYELSLWKAFNEIATMRPGGMATQPIPIDAIAWFADRHNYSPTQEKILTRVVRNMDGAFLKAVRARAVASS